MIYDDFNVERSNEKRLTTDSDQMHQLSCNMGSNIRMIRESRNTVS